MKTHDPSLNLCQRKDLAMFQIVEGALHMFQKPAYQARYMCWNNVPFAVAHRVVLQPHLRRKAH